MAMAVAQFAECGSVKIEAMKHDIQQITDKNFDGVISKFRESAVSSLWFFKDDNKQDEAFLAEYNKVASELKGMAKICAISCTAFPLFCKKQGIEETPAVMIYPTNPMPAFKYEGKLDSKGITGKVVKLFPDYSLKLSKDNIDEFVTGDASKPKVILFSNKKSVPMIWKALSSETVFKRTMKFGFVTEDDTELVQRFNVKKFPMVVMQRGSKAEIKEAYKGEMNFWSLKDWINLHSESGMGDKVFGGSKADVPIVEEARPWLAQEVPELTGKSHQDVCFRGEGLCVIFLKDGVATSEEIDMLAGLSKKFTSQLGNRGAKMKFMWMNLAIEPEFKAMFRPAGEPSAVVFNPHKRLRFAQLEHSANMQCDGSSISSLVDKVLGGDARFKMVTGQVLPGWAKREEGKKEL